MPIESLKRRGLPAAAAVSIACLALVSGCKSSGTSSGSAGQPSGGNPSAAAGGATSAAGSATTAAAAAGSGSFKPACPTAAVVTSALGTTLPAPVQNGDAATGIVCNYSDSGSGADAVISFTALPAGSAGGADIKIAADAQAQAQGVTASAVSGLGDSAYIFTQKDAADNPDGVATTVLIVLVGNEDIDIAAQAPAAKVEGLAHTIIGG